MKIERLQMSIQTVKDNIKILESQEPEDAGYYLQLEHEKMVLDALEKQMPKHIEEQTDLEGIDCQAVFANRKANRKKAIKMSDKEIKFCANEKMAIDILDFIKRGYEKNYQDGGVQKYIEALQMGIDALTELNRQQAEIERLTEQLDGETVANMRLKHEIERLNLENLQMVASIKRLTNDFVDFNKMVKSEAIKEFAERLCKDRVSNDPVVITVKAELKKMEGEG